MNTLYLPTGCVNEYRYRHTGEGANVSAAFMSKLAKIATNTDCALIFVDRYSPGAYTYHPLRFGKFVGYRTEAGYIYVKVALDRYTYPRNLTAFQKSLVGHLDSQGLVRLTDNTPENTRDGHYVIESDTIFGQTEDFYQDNEAWKVAVDHLAETRALSTNEDQVSVFLKAQLRDRKKQSFLKPDSSGNSHILGLVKDRAYELVLTYRFPKQQTDRTAQLRFDATIGDVLRAQGNTAVNVDSLSNSVVVPFTTKRYAEDNSGSIVLKSLEANSKPEIISPDASVEYVLEEGKSFWFQIFSFVLVYVLAGACLALDFSKLRPFMWATVGSALWPRLLFGVAQAASLFFLFRTVGKKVF